jgi:hypothetical protein
MDSEEKRYSPFLPLMTLCPLSGVPCLTCGMRGKENEGVIEYVHTTRTEFYVSKTLN